LRLMVVEQNRRRYAGSEACRIDCEAIADDREKEGGVIFYR
jgi:hypothetical protein